MNVSYTIRQHYLFDRDQKRVSLDQFLRDPIFEGRCSSISMYFDEWRNFVYYKLFSKWLILLLFFYSMFVLCVTMY